MAERKRLQFRCHSCKELYSLTRHLPDGEQPRLIVACPFCQAEAVVDLAPWRDESVTLAKGIGDQVLNGDETPSVYQLPEILPTQPV